MKTNYSKRQFLKLGLLSVGTFGIVGCDDSSNTSHRDGDNESRNRRNSDSPSNVLPFGIDLEKWKAGKGKDYELGKLW